MRVGSVSALSQVAFRPPVSVGEIVKLPTGSEAVGHPQLHVLSVVWEAVDAGESPFTEPEA